VARNAATDRQGGERSFGNAKPFSNLRESFSINGKWFSSHGESSSNLEEWFSSHGEWSLSHEESLSNLRESSSNLEV